MCFPHSSVVKNLPAVQEAQVQSLGGKIPWRRKWQVTPVFLPGKSHGKRNVLGYSSGGHKESNTTEVTAHVCTYTHTHIYFLFMMLRWSVVSDSLQTMDHSSPDSSVHVIPQARRMEWVAIPFSRGSSPPRDWTWVSCIAGGFSTNWATRKANYIYILTLYSEKIHTHTHTHTHTYTLWPLICSWLIGRKHPEAGKDWRQKEKRGREDEMVGWHHWLNGHELGQSSGHSEGQEGPVCCSPRGRKESDKT